MSSVSQKISMSESQYVRKSVCQKVSMSESQYVSKSECQKVSKYSREAKDPAHILPFGYELWLHFVVGQFKMIIIRP